MADKKKLVYVVYYSMYGHVQKLARQALAGVERAGVDAKLFQVAETLPQEILTKMHAPPKASDVSVITPADLKQADGILFGMPTRFGMAPAQVKALFDSCGQLWLRGDFTGSLGAGQETTAFSCLPFFAHMGMIYVTIGGKHKSLGNLNEVHGGSPWGAGTIAAADGSRQPSRLELDLAEFQGFDFANVVKRN